MQKKNATSLRAAILTSFAAALLIGDVSASRAETAKPDQTMKFNIPAGDLATALKSFGEQSDTDVLFDPRLAAFKRTAGLTGTHETQEGLRILLAEANLRFRVIDGKTVLIEAVDGADLNPSSATGEGSVAQWETRLAQNEQAMKTDQVPEAKDELQDVRLEEIVVTARKVSERLQDVPISVTAISGIQLKKLGAADIKDVLGMVPGLAYETQDRGKSLYSIRGIASGPTTTGVYIDDISVLTPRFGGGGVAAGSTDAVFLDMERVEVLKGPQGTFYGGSAMGGAIKYVSARPDVNEAFGSGAIGGALTKSGDKSYNAEGVVNLPLVQGTLAFRGGLYFSHEGGYIDNVANLPVEDATFSTSPFPIYTPKTESSLGQINEDDFNDSNTFAARASLLLTPDDSFSIRPFVYHQDFKLDNPSEYFTNVSGLNASYRYATQVQNDRFTLYGLDVNKRFGAVEITSLTGYFDRLSVRGRDYGVFVARALPFLPFETNSFEDYSDQNKTFSQEFRFASAPGSTSPLTWLSGLYYSNRENQLDYTINVFSPLFPVPLYGGDINTKDKEYAAFGEVTYRLFGKLDLTAGVRIFKYDTHTVDKSVGIVAGAQSDLEFSGKGVNPKFGIAFKPNRDHMLYASAAKGFRQGGPVSGASFPAAFLNTPECQTEIAALGLSGVPKGYESDSVWTYEAGSKNEFSDGKALVNGAVFQTDWEDIQQSISLPQCRAAFQGNAGAARIRGAELETNISVSPSFRFGGTLSYIDAEITDSGQFGTTFIVGSDTQSTPKWMSSAFAEFRKDLPRNWEMQLRGDYQYRSDARLVYNDTLQVTYSDGVRASIPNAAERNPGYDIANLNLTFDNNETSVRFFARNLFNSQPRLDYTQVLLQHSRASTLRPRTIGLEIRQKF